MKAGDVALVRFPFSALESEPFKQRPILVVNAFGSPPDQVVLTMMITSNTRRVARPGPGDIVIEGWSAAGLAQPSVLRSRRIWTGEQRDVTRVIGAVDADTLAAARTAIRDMVG